MAPSALEIDGSNKVLIAAVILRVRVIVHRANNIGGSDSVNTPSVLLLEFLKVLLKCSFIALRELATVGLEELGKIGTRGATILPGSARMSLCLAMVACVLRKGLTSFSR